MLSSALVYTLPSLPFYLDPHFSCASSYCFISHFLKLNITVLTINPSHIRKTHILLSHFLHINLPSNADFCWWMPSLDPIAQSVAVYKFNNGVNLWLLRFHPFIQKKNSQTCYSGTRLTSCQTLCFLVCLFSTLLLCATQVLFESIKLPLLEMSFTHFIEDARECIRLTTNGHLSRLRWS